LIAKNTAEAAAVGFEMNIAQDFAQNGRFASHLSRNFRPSR
jgi:hypothetical protein